MSLKKYPTRKLLCTAFVYTVSIQIEKIQHLLLVAELPSIIWSKIAVTPHIALQRRNNTTEKMLDEQTEFELSISYASQKLTASCSVQETL